jgi:hypothetical protein
MYPFLERKRKRTSISPFKIEIYTKKALLFPALSPPDEDFPPYFRK